MTFRLTTSALCLLPGLLTAADFKRDIAPVLKAKCYSCHSEEAKKEKSGYVFDNLKRLQGDIGPAGQIIPGNADESPLMDLITAEDGDKRRMPPNGKPGLTVKEIKAFREWINDGASLEKKSAAKPSGLAPRPAAVPELKWTSNDNKTIEAAFVALEKDTVVLKKGSRTWRIPMERLSPESQAQARKLAVGPSL